MNSTPVSAAQGTTTRVRYRAQCWLRANTDWKGNDYFEKLLKESAFQVQTAYRRLMTAHAGEPIGIECRTDSRNAWAFVAQEPGEPGRFRIQYFDEDSFSNHLVYNGLPEAVETMLKEGYCQVDAGALDRVAATPRWARGVKVATLRQKYQEDLITYDEMLAAIKAL